MDKRTPLSIIFAVTFGLICVSCTAGAGDHTRPSGVPRDAYWVGGPDGGAFVKLDSTPINSGRALLLEVYSDATGEILYSGPVKVEPATAPLSNLADPRLFTAWDGEALHLADGRELRVVPHAKRTQKVPH
jgi:hypothetical protein